MSRCAIEGLVRRSESDLLRRLHCGSALVEWHCVQAQACRPPQLCFRAVTQGLTANDKPDLHSEQHFCSSTSLLYVLGVVLVIAKAAWPALHLPQGFQYDSNRAGYFYTFLLLSDEPSESLVPGTPLQTLRQAQAVMKSCSPAASCKEPRSESLALLTLSTGLLYSVIRLIGVNTSSLYLQILTLASNTFLRTSEAHRWHSRGMPEGRGRGPAL